MATRSKAELMNGFIREGAVGGLVNSVAEVADDPQVVHNEVLTMADYGADGRVRGTRPPARFAASPAVAAGPAPMLGEYGRDVLAALGFSKEDVAGFVADGVLAG